MHIQTGVLIAGGTGLIGQALQNFLSQIGYKVYVLSRAKGENTRYWNPQNNEIQQDVFKDIDYVINLAGAGIADKRWTKARKQLLLNSRTEAVKVLAKALREQPNHVKFFLQASAVGYYGNSKESIVSENSPRGLGFLAQICALWEQAATSIPVPFSIVRIGVVLSTKGGALPKIAQAVQWNLGAALGNGKQYLPWITMDDLLQIFLFLLVTENPPKIVNAVAPYPVTNAVFIQQLANHLHKIFIPLPVPAFLLQLALGEMAATVLEGQRASPNALIDAGFSFRFPELKQAFLNLYA